MLIHGVCSVCGGKTVHPDLRLTCSISEQCDRSRNYTYPEYCGEFFAIECLRQEEENKKSMIETESVQNKNTNVEAPTEESYKAEWWQPNRDRLIVKPMKPEERTKSGVWLPETVQIKQAMGTIVGAGPGNNEYGFFVPNKLRVGDVVIFSKHAGYEFKLDGEDVIIIRECDVLAAKVINGVNPLFREKGVQDRYLPEEDGKTRGEIEPPL